MSFFDEFEPLPAPPPPRRLQMKPWMGKPRDWLGGWVSWHGTLLRGPDVRVTLEHVQAYPSGVSFELRIMRRQDSEPQGVAAAHQMVLGGLGGARYGVEFSDGRRSVSQPLQIVLEGEPNGPVLLPNGGGGSGGEWRTSLWLWPLPPPGPLRLFATWPEQGCDEAVVEFDADEILGAAEHAEHLWDVDL